MSACANGLPDPRHGSNTRYTVNDGVFSAFANFFLQDPSCSSFQRRVEDSAGRSNCQSLFPSDNIPGDNPIRSLLDGCRSDAFDSVFPLGLETLDNEGALCQFARLHGRLVIALDGIEFQKSYKIRCPHCSVRHVGLDRKKQYFHSMVAAAVADGHDRVLPLMPEFIDPFSDPAAKDSDLSDEGRKQDCERNAAKLPRQNSVACR